MNGSPSPLNLDSTLIKNPLNQLESPKPGSDLMQSIATINVKVKNTQNNQRSPEKQPIPNKDLKSVASSLLYDSNNAGSGSMIPYNGGASGIPMGGAGPRKSVNQEVSLQI